METHLRYGQDKTVNKRLCSLEDIPEGGSKGFEVNVDGETVQLFVVRKSGAIFGYLNDCPHIGTPLNWKNTRFLTMDGSQIVCATHGALFRIEDGYCTAGPCIGMNLKRVKVDCVADYIFVNSLSPSG